MSETQRDYIKLIGGVSSGVGANVVGIPLDRFRIMVAQDANFSRPVRGHFADTMGSLGGAYTGGLARVGMKGMASTMNLFIPAELRAMGPFTASLVTGFVCSPLLNAARMLQMAKINGERYPAAARRLFTTGAGLRTYANNTAMFAPGEALRMMLCFGTKDFLAPLVDSDSKPAPQSRAEVAGRAARLAVMIGPVVAIVESSASVMTETASTVHAKIGAISSASSTAVGGAAATLRAEALGAIANPRYIARCFTALLSKNVVANTATFFFMFAADEYTRYVTTVRNVCAEPRFERQLHNSRLS
jgi:hypothetical protein